MTVIETPIALDGAEDLGANACPEISKLAEYKLRSVVKDQRVQPALHAAYCNIKTAVPCANLLLVLTNSTLTIYDDFHMGDHVAIVAQYVHEDAEGEEKTSLVSAAWIPGALDSEKNAVKRDKGGLVLVRSVAGSSFDSTYAPFTHRFDGSL